MGLLDFLNSPEAQTGIALMAAGGPTSQPMSFGQRLAGAMQNMQAMQDAGLKRKLVQSQLDENASQSAYRTAQLGQLQQDQAMNAVILDRLRSRFGPQAGGAAGATGYGQAPAAQFGGSQASSGGAGDGIAGTVGVGGGQPQGMGGMPTGVQGGGIPGRGGFMFTPDEIAAWAAMGRKGASELFDQMKYYNEGVKREAGNYYRDPISGAETYYPKLGEGMVRGANGVVGMAPGYIGANAASKAFETDAVEGAKYPYTVGADRAKQMTQAQLDVVRVTGPDGNDYFVPRAQVAGFGGGTGGAGGSGGAGGFGNSGTPYMAGLNPVTQQAQTAVNENWVKNIYQPAIDSGKSATNTIAGIQAIRNIDMNTGWGTETKAAAAAVLEGLGVNVGNSKIYAANAQKFQSVAMDKVNAELLAQKGVQAKDDAERAKQTYVSLGNTPEANSFILDYAEAKANMDARRAAYYEAALPLARREGDLTAVDRNWRKVAGSIWADPVLQKWKK